MERLRIPIAWIWLSVLTMGCGGTDAPSVDDSSDVASNRTQLDASVEPLLDASVTDDVGGPSGDVSESMTAEETVETSPDLDVETDGLGMDSDMSDVDGADGDGADGDGVTLPSDTFVGPMDVAGTVSDVAVDTLESAADVPSVDESDTGVELDVETDAAGPEGDASEAASDAVTEPQDVMESVDTAAKDGGEISDTVAQDVSLPTDTGSMDDMSQPSDVGQALEDIALTDVTDDDTALVVEPETMDDVGAPDDDVEQSALNCDGFSLGSNSVCVEIDTASSHPLANRISGFNVNLFHQGWQPWDPELVERTLPLHPGWLRFPGGSASYVYDWRTGTVPTEWIQEFDPNKIPCESDADCCADGANCDPLDSGICVFDKDLDSSRCRTVCPWDCEVLSGDEKAACDVSKCGQKLECVADDTAPAGYGSCRGSKVVNFASYKQTVEGKGLLKIREFARFADEVGASIVVNLNAFTDDAESALAFVRYVKRNGIKVALWELTTEPNYWVKEPLNFFDSGQDYAEMMLPYTEAIWEVFPDAPISVSYADGDTEGQRDFNLSVGDYSLQNGNVSDKYWNHFTYHWYPGKKGQDVEVGMPEVNGALVLDALGRLDSHFLPLNGIPLPGDPVPSVEDLGLVVSEYNVRFTSNYTGTLYAALHTAEYVTRLASHPRTQYLGYHMLVSKCITSAEEHRQTVKKVGKLTATGKLSTIDPALLSYEPHTALPCVALGRVNRVVNTSSHRWETKTVGGSTVPSDPEIPHWGNEEQCAMLESNEDEGDDAYYCSQVAAVYAQSYQGRDGDAHLLLTNRSDLPQELSLLKDGVEFLEGFTATVLTGDEPGWILDGSGPEVTFEALGTQGPLTVPAYSVVHLQWQHASPTVQAPTDLTLTPDVHAIHATWQGTSEAESYHLKVGVQAGLYHQVMTVPADEQGMLQATLDALPHGVPLYVAVSAVGPGGESVNVTDVSNGSIEAWQSPPLFGESFDTAASLDAWEVECPASNCDHWSFGAEGQTLDVIYSGASRYVTGDGVWTEPVGQDEPLWSDDVNIATRFTVDSWQDDGRIGILARYSGPERYYLLYYDHLERVFRILKRTEDTVKTIGSSLVLAKEYIDVGATEPWLPVLAEIDPGVTHTLRFELDGSTLRGWLDGVLMVSAVDQDIIEGKAGLYVKHQATVFDDFEVRTQALYGP